LRLNFDWKFSPIINRKQREFHMTKMKNGLDLDEYTTEELIMMNQLICLEVDRRHKRHLKKELSAFEVSDRVYFDHPDGYRCHGTILRVNQKSVSVRADDNHMWRIAAGLVKKEQAQSAKMRGNLISMPSHRQ
jgi:hypothetical protein